MSQCGETLPVPFTVTEGSSPSPEKLSLFKEWLNTFGNRVYLEWCFFCIQQILFSVPVHFHPATLSYVPQTSYKTQKVTCTTTNKLITVEPGDRNITKLFRRWLFIVHGMYSVCKWYFV